MATIFTTELRRAFDQASVRLPEEARAHVRRARSTRKTTLEERDRLLGEMVEEYRQGPAELWAPAILDLLAPAMAVTLGHVHRRAERIAELWDYDEPLVVDEEDVRQQLIFEVLRAAATIPLRPGGRAMKIRLLKRSNTYLTRWLKRDWRHQVQHCSLEALEVDEEDDSESNG